MERKMMERLTRNRSFQPDVRNRQHD
jgi:hypothetical protein